MKRVRSVIEAASDALAAQLAHFTAELNERTARVEQRHYYRGYEAGFNDARDPILCITPEDVESTRMAANTYIESEDEHVVRWLRALVLNEPMDDTPQDSSANGT